MKKYIVISILALGLTISAGAQKIKSVTYPASIEINKAKALWFNTENAAGMVITPLDKYNILDFSYGLESGEYKFQQKGDTENRFNIATEGLSNFREGLIWGRFSYSNSRINDTKYNTILIDPQPDMPYYIADPNVSFWKKHFYDMGFKASTPLLWNMAAFGLSVNYYTKTGAKQIDPRCSSSINEIEANPSFIIKNGRHIIGITGMYSNSTERVYPVNSNHQEDQPVFLLRGLGNHMDGIVGSLNGINPYYYKSNQVGGAFQYGFISAVEVLAEGKYLYRVIDVYQTPSKPQRMGSTVRNLFAGNIQVLSKGEYMSKITLDCYYSNTDGIEYVQQIDKTYEVQQWITIAKYVRSSYKFKAASLNYDFFNLGEKGYDWKAGLKAVYSDRKDEYILPHSTFDAENVYGEICGAKNFIAGKTSFLVSISAGYNYNIGGEYIYGGSNKTSVIVTDFLKKDNAFLTSNYVQAGINLNSSFPLSTKTAMYLQGDCKYIKADTDIIGKNRIIASFSIGFTF